MYKNIQKPWYNYVDIIHLKLGTADCDNMHYITMTSLRTELDVWYVFQSSCHAFNSDSSVVFCRSWSSPTMHAKVTQGLWWFDNVDTFRSCFVFNHTPCKGQEGPQCGRWFELHQGSLAALLVQQCKLKHDQDTDRIKHYYESNIAHALDVFFFLYFFCPCCIYDCMPAKYQRLPSYVYTNCLPPQSPLCNYPCAHHVAFQTCLRRISRLSR